MTIEEFEKLKKGLLDKGYKKQNYSIFSREDYSYYKTLRYEKDKYGDNRAVCQIFYKVYDYVEYKKKYSRNDIEDHYGVEVLIDVSRNVSEREEYITTANPLDIEANEKNAKKFYEFIEKNVPLQKEY